MRERTNSPLSPDYLERADPDGLAGILPTGKRVGVAGMGIDYFSGGKTAESWEYYDVLGMMQQVDVVPYPE